MRVLARVLLGLGVFLLIAGVLAVAWAPGVVKQTPLDVDTTTVYAGEAAKIDTATGAFDKEPVFAITRTKADAESPATTMSCSSRPAVRSSTPAGPGSASTATTPT